MVVILNTSAEQYSKVTLGDSYRANTSLLLGTGHTKSLHAVAGLNLCVFQLNKIRGKDMTLTKEAQLILGYMELALDGYDDLDFESICKDIIEYLNSDSRAEELGG